MDGAWKPMVALTTNKIWKKNTLPYQLQMFLIILQADKF